MGGDTSEGASKWLAHGLRTTQSADMAGAQVTPSEATHVTRDSTPCFNHFLEFLFLASIYMRF